MSDNTSLSDATHLPNELTVTSQAQSTNGEATSPSPAPEGEERLSSLQKDGELVRPSASVIERANVKDFDALYQRSIADAPAFWAEQAQELDWAQGWSEIMRWQPPVVSNNTEGESENSAPSTLPHLEWFIGAKCNITLNALDRHAQGDRRNKAAFVWVSEPDAQGKVSERIYTYGQLLRRVNQCAHALKSLGVEAGDRVTVYMALTPELPITMLACARIGAIHSVVYGGFSAPALRSRIEDSQSKVVVGTDIGYRRGKVIDLKGAVAEAVSGVECVQHVLLYRRAETTTLDMVPQGGETAAYTPITHDWTALCDEQSPYGEATILDAEAPLFFLYTSGTTGKPKGVVHAHGGYMVGTSYTHKLCFDLHENDIYLCTADPGWITGHSYVVYGPLINGATVMLVEGALDFPDAGRWWSVVEKYGVNIFYTTPTAIRALMRFGEEFPAKYDLSSLKVLGSVGEPLNPEAWQWFFHNVGHSNCPISDTWWQTETGQFMIATIPSYPAKPGSPGKPLPGIEAAIVDREGNPVPPGHGGFLALKKPWPGMMRAIYQDPERYAKYWTTIPGFYSAGDVATCDEDGYFRVMGRADDVMNVSGYRIGTAEVESALVAHPSVAEAAVIGVPDPLKGENIKAFVILRQGQEGSDELVAALRAQVRSELGPIAMPGAIEFVASLPKTRSGKIMRRVLKAKELGVAPGDISTLED